MLTYPVKYRKKPNAQIKSIVKRTIGGGSDMTDERLDQILKQALAPEIADTEIAVKQAFLKLQIK